MKHFMKQSKKAVALLLAVLMMLSVFSVVGFAGADEPGDESGDGGETPEETTYTVRFFNQAEHSIYDPDGNVQPAKVIDFEGTVCGVNFTTAIWEQTVVKGGDAVDPFAAAETDSDKEAMAEKVLTYPETLAASFYKPAFKCWDKALTNVQSDLNIYPEFQTVGKQYKIIYHNLDGTKYLYRNGVKVDTEVLNAEECVYGEYPQESSTPFYPVVEGDNDNKIEHLTYTFAFRGWSLKPGIDPTKNPDDSKYLLDWSNGLELPTNETLGQFDKEQPGYINLTEEIDGVIPLNVYAYYTRHTKEYLMSLTVTDSFNQPVNHAAVQIKDATGQLLRQTYAATDENGNPTGQYKAATGYTDENGAISFKVPFQTIYTIEASDDTLGAIIKELPYTDSQHFNLAQRTISCSVSLNPSSAGYNEQYKPRCTCACHSFIGGIWVMALNLMYHFFKIKYVCCYDMYATHGDKLSYAA